MINNFLKTTSAADSAALFAGWLQHIQPLLAAVLLLLQPASALAADYAGGGFVTIAPEMTSAYISANPDAVVVIENLKLENGNTLSIVLDPELPDRIITSANDNTLEFGGFFTHEVKERKLRCLDLQKDLYAKFHGTGELGSEFNFASGDKRHILGSTDDLVKIIDEINRAQPGVIKPGSNIGVTSCYFEGRLIRDTTPTCPAHYVNTSAAIKLKHGLMNHPTLKHLKINLLSLSSSGEVFAPKEPMPPGSLVSLGASCEPLSEVRLYEDVVDAHGPHLTEIAIYEIPDDAQRLVELGIRPEDTYTELYVKNRSLITKHNLHRIDTIAEDLVPYVIKKRRYSFAPPHIAPPRGSALAAKVFSKGMLFIDTVFSLWEIGQVTYHSVLFYNEHTGAIDSIKTAAVMEDKWRKDLGTQIDDVKRIQYREDAGWAINVLNYILGEQAKKEELYAYWEKQGRPRNVFYESDYIVNINNNIIFSYWRWRGRESYAAVDPELKSTAWKINVNPLIPGGTYYEPEWEPLPRPYLEELILIPGVREEMLKNISDLDCDIAKRSLGGKTSDEIGHSDLIALVGYLASQAYQELIDAAVLTNKPKDHFIHPVTRGWAMHRKRAIEEAEKNPQGTSSLQPPAWIGIAGPGKLEKEYFAFLP